MPHFGSKYSSEYLASDQMAASVGAIPRVLAEIFGDCTFTAYYGCGTNLHNALLYIPMAVQTGVLPYFLEDSIDQRIVVPGESDLIIESPAKGLEITCCHESDIHIDGENEEAMERFMSAEPFAEIKFYSRDELQALHPDHKL
jgi:hypothetical protein